MKEGKYMVFLVEFRLLKHIFHMVNEAPHLVEMSSMRVDKSDPNNSISIFYEVQMKRNTSIAIGVATTHLNITG